MRLLGRLQKQVPPLGLKSSVAMTKNKGRGRGPFGCALQKLYEQVIEDQWNTPGRMRRQKNEFKANIHARLASVFTDGFAKPSRLRAGSELGLFTRNSRFEGARLK